MIFNTKKDIKKDTKAVKIKKSPLREWIDAILFAVVAATLIRMFFIEAYTIPTSSMEKSLLIGDFLFVSKVNYGPRIPNTPLSFPFAHHTMPVLGTQSYLEWLKLPYLRLPGFQKIKNNDVVVFNYPMEDFRPVDKRENYIKRCIGIPGDTLSVVNGEVFLNGKLNAKPENMQFNYSVKTDGTTFNQRSLMKYDITEFYATSNFGDFNMTLTNKNLEHIKVFPNVQSVTLPLQPKGQYMDYIFPHDPILPWNVDNFGPLYIPKKGAIISLDAKNLAIYRRAIQVYENNKVDVINGKVFINDKVATTYTFKLDYYFMMGDNRHNSADSRFWGFVPEDHVVGKAVFIWLSLNGNEPNILKKVRWKRLFNLIR